MKNLQKVCAVLLIVIAFGVMGISVFAADEDNAKTDSVVEECSEDSFAQLKEKYLEQIRSLVTKRNEKFVRKTVERAVKKIEALHYDSETAWNEYDSTMNELLNNTVNQVSFSSQLAAAVIAAVQNNNTNPDDITPSEPEPHNNPNEATLYFEGKSASIWIANIAFNDYGKLIVSLAGDGINGEIPVRDNRMIAQYQANIVVDSTEYQWEALRIIYATDNVTMNQYAYTFSVSKMPDQVILYSYDEKQVRHAYDVKLGNFVS